MPTDATMGRKRIFSFDDLRIKKLNEGERRLMEELIEEHRFGRKVTARLVEANTRYAQGDHEALSAIMDCVRSLIGFYPKHIEKEDKHFFIPCMDYFSEAEQEAMLKEEWEFDKSLIHEKYRNMVFTVEKLLIAKKL